MELVCFLHQLVCTRANACEREREREREIEQKRHWISLISHELSLSITIQYFISHFGVNVVQKDDIKYHNQNLMTLPKEIK